MNELLNYEGACDLTRKVFVVGAHKNFETKGFVQPLAFVFGRRSVQGAPLAEPTMVGVLPVTCVEIIKAMCKVCDAFAVVCVYEGWTLMIDNSKVYEDPYEHGTIKDHPKRRECICVTLEHQHGTAGWLTTITRDGDIATLSEPVESRETAQGRLSNFLGKSRVPEA
jgi:hypothetical protein